MENIILPKEWHELAQREGVILNPSNEDKQEVYRLAFADGAQAMLTAVEKLVKDSLTQINKDLRSTNDREAIIGLNGEKTALELVLNELKSIQP